MDSELPKYCPRNVLGRLGLPAKPGIVAGSAGVYMSGWVMTKMGFAFLKDFESAIELCGFTYAMGI